jgi:N-acetyl-alpha-D-glucosaminyl L-malate synthase BshA
MTIVIFVSFFPPKWLAGIEIATYNIAKHLSQRGHNVHVVTSLDKGLPSFSNEPGFNVHRISCRKVRILGVMQFWCKIFIKIYQIKPDIVHIQAIGNGVPGFLAKLMLKIPYVVCGHGSDVYLSWAFKKPISKIVLSNADAVIALTDDMKNELVKIHRKPINVIPNGVEVEKFNVNGNKKRLLMNEKTLLFVGTLHQVKGIRYLIQAMSIVRNNSKANLTIIGDGEEKEELKEFANKLNLSDCIHFAGRIDNEKIPEYMSQADIFVLPSLSEGLPVVSLEAMASGLPIVATNVGGLPDIIEDGINGFLVEPKNYEQLAEKIILLLNDDELRLKISRANREKAKKYDWSSVVEQLEEVYYSVYSRH